MSPADPDKAPPWWWLYIVAPVIVGVILLIAGGVVGGVFPSDDKHATPPSATPPPPVGPSSPPPPPTVPSSSLTVGEFAQRANEICVDTSPRIGEFRKPIRGLIPRAVNGDKSAEQAVRQQIEKFKRVLRERQRRLNALGAPEGKAQATAEEFVRADSAIQHGLLAASSDVQDALKQGNRRALVNRVSRLKQTDLANSREGARRDALARELGAEQCARRLAG